MTTLTRPLWPGKQGASPRLAAGLVTSMTQLAVILGVLLLWHAALATGVVSSSGIPYPADTFGQLYHLLGSGAYWAALGRTLGDWALSILICAALALPAGFAIGLSDRASTSTRLVIDFMRTIPPVALIPLLLLLYGPGPEMKVVLAVCGAVWPLLVQAIYAANQVDPTLMQVARSFQLGWRERVMALYVPSALPFVATGVRVAATISLLLCIAAELIGGAPGVGKEISAAELNGNLGEMYAYVLTAATLGFLMNALLKAAQRKLLWWHPSMRGGQE